MLTYHPPAGPETTRATMRIRGLIAAVVLGLVGTVLYQSARGTYDDTFTLTVVAEAIGEGLTPGAEVKFHGLTIGSVKTLRTTGYNTQTMTVHLDPRQARALTADTQARFTSSNVFGSAAVELVSSGGGATLAPNQTLLIDAGVPAASITGMLRQGQKLSQLIDTPEFGHIVEMLHRHGDLVEPVTKSTFDFAKILADAQTVPFSQSLSVLASFANGLDDTIPLVGLVNELLDGLAFLAQPEGVDRTTLVLRQSSQLIKDSGQLFVQNNPWMIPLVEGMMNVGIPLAFAQGSLAPAYDRLSGLLDRTSAAFPVIDGRVRMQVEVILDTMPWVTTGLATEPEPGGR